MKHVLITGGRGFVGSHVVEHILKTTDWHITIFDKLSYAALPKDRLTDIDIWRENAHRVNFYALDLYLPVPELVEKETGRVDYIFHLAAESHVDNSIAEPVGFVMNNVKATLTMLEFARRVEPDLFVNFSTDEVYGPAPYPRRFSEGDRHFPTNPYSASKSAQEQLGKAWSNCWNLPVITTHTMNVFGERQHPEKFVPLCVRRILAGETVTIHADASRKIAGSRSYLHARNLADALLHVVTRPEVGFLLYDEWNIAGLKEVSNLELAQAIADILGKRLDYEMVDFHSSRPGHDLRYALDSTKLVNSGYAYPVDFEESLERTVLWTVEHRKDWL